MSMIYVTFRGHTPDLVKIYDELVSKCTDNLMFLNIKRYLPEATFYSDYEPSKAYIEFNIIFAEDLEEENSEEEDLEEENLEEEDLEK